MCLSIYSLVLHSGSFISFHSQSTYLTLTLSYISICWFRHSCVSCRTFSHWTPAATADSAASVAAALWLGDSGMSSPVTSRTACISWWMTRPNGTTTNNYKHSINTIYIYNINELLWCREKNHKLKKCKNPVRWKYSCNRDSVPCIPLLPRVQPILQRLFISLALL